jgi:hypothetical protein
MTLIEIEIKDIILDAIVKQEQDFHINPINRCAARTFSQTNEDGITFEILRRMDSLESGTYLEFGPGQGLENNTLALAALGWRGCWFGGQDLVWNYQPSNKLLFEKTWITLESIPVCIDKSLNHLNVKDIDVVSMDLDGNDAYFVHSILNYGLRPKLFITEYNATFIPPIKFQIDYNPNHEWVYDDYYGASITTFNEMFESFGYRLVCCNTSTGANAFFIHKDFDHAFTDVPTDINKLYARPKYHLPNKFSHGMSPQVVEKIFRE